MSEFTGDGFTSFPNLYSDNLHIGEISEWEEYRVEQKVTDYWLFLERTDIQARARNTAKRILEHLGFEMDYRYGAYDTAKEEVCDGVA